MARGPGDRASKDELENFTNRVAEREAIRCLLDATENDAVPVLVFYGVGGVGKTLLTKKALANGTSSGHVVAWVG
ncbi:MAG: hypothetical protein ACO1SV_13155 [Fimbriimonas sp.]